MPEHCEICIALKASWKNVKTRIDYIRKNSGLLRCLIKVPNTCTCAAQFRNYYKMRERENLRRWVKHCELNRTTKRETLIKR